MTNVAKVYTPKGQAWDQIFLPAKVEKESDLYPIFDKSLFDVKDTRRADKTPSKSSDFGFKLEAYNCEEYAQHTLISKRERDNSDLQTTLEQTKVQLVKQMVMNDLEMQVFGASGLLRTAANNGYSNNVSWANLATASPRGDIETAIESVEVNSGMTPNTIVLSPRLARHIIHTDEYREERQYTNDFQMIGGVRLPSDFYGLRAVYARSIFNLSSGSPKNKGQARAFERVMGDDIWVGYIDPSGLTRETMTFGAWLYTEEYVASWWDDDLRSDKYEYGTIGQLKVVAAECGGLLTSALT